MSGQDIKIHFVEVLMRFQQEPIAMMTDIESMFFRYDEEHQNFARLLQLEDNKLKEEQFDFQMCEHFFGGTSSLKFCNYALKRTLIENKMNLKKKAAETLKSNFYIEYMLKSTKKRCYWNV